MVIGTSPYAVLYGQNASNLARGGLFCTMFWRGLDRERENSRWCVVSLMELGRTRRLTCSAAYEKNTSGVPTEATHGSYSMSAWAGGIHDSSIRKKSRNGRTVRVQE